MNKAMAIAASGMTAATAQFGAAASQLVGAQAAADAPASNVAQPAASAGQTITAPSSLGSGVAVSLLVSSDPAAPMVSMIEARASFQANLAAFKAADSTFQSLLTIVA